MREYSKINDKTFLFTKCLIYVSGRRLHRNNVLSFRYINLPVVDLLFF